MEHWLAITNEEYKDYYEISNLGNVKLLRRNNKITKGYLNKDGYKYITGNNKNKRSTLFIHRLVAEAFIPNPENKPCINHIDGNKTNNNVENLEWCTYSENMKHAVKTKLHLNCTFKGELHNTSKHSNLDIENIRKEYKQGNISMRALAKKYSTSSGYISDVINNKIRINNK